MRPDRADWAIKRIVQHMIDIQEGTVAPPLAPPPGTLHCPKPLKRRIKAAFSHCEYCGRPADKWQYLTVDRIVPGAAGGRYDPANITGACMRCNFDKGSGDFVGPVRSLLVMEARHHG